ncbi:MAG TPA: DinB family protein [Bryobacteraceae bacterium]|nr:DinB family protein [Bryobacteraceae bacterium]
MRIIASLVGVAAALTALAAPLSDGDRGRILTELQTSRKLFLDSVADLTPAQWTYKAGPDRWSIAEVSEHIVAAEGYIGGSIIGVVLKSPADAAKASQREPNNAKIDEGVLVALRDRSKTATAPAEITPKGIYKTPAEAVDAFNAARDKTVDYVKNSQDDMRDHFFSPIPGTELDGVQAFLFLAGHNERHVEQIEEVKKSPGYPK